MVEKLNLIKYNSYSWRIKSILVLMTMNQELTSKMLEKFFWEVKYEITWEKGEEKINFKIKVNIFFIYL